MDWKPIIYQYSLHITGNRWDAEDLTQETLIKLLEALKVNPERPVTKAFLYRIAKNTWIDSRRGRKIVTEQWNPMDEAGTEDYSLSSRELLEQLSERLPPVTAVILLLMEVFDFTAKETAEIVRMKESAVQVSIGRARRKLKKLAQDSYTESTSTCQAVRSSAHHAVDFDSLVDAFRRRDPHAIYRSYIGLAREGVQLTMLVTRNGRLHFTFRDPDGNLFHIVSN
jgi:RNA polymerase sigma factor (sigma-70 family)